MCNFTYIVRTCNITHSVCNFTHSMYSYTLCVILHMLKFRCDALDTPQAYTSNKKMSRTKLGRGNLGIGAKEPEVPKREFGVFWIPA